MKICWDNIENIRLTRNGNFRDVIKKKTYVIINECKQCGDEFLSIKDDKSLFCSRHCSCKYNSMDINNPMYGRNHTEETKQKISKSRKNKLMGDENPSKRKDVRKKIRNSKLNKHHTEKTKKKISLSKSGCSIPKIRGENHHNWKGGYNSKDMPLYDTYAFQLEWCEEVRRSPKDKNVLEVKCTYCGKWYVPSLGIIKSRIQYLKGNEKYRGEFRFYCSEPCKQACPIYHKQVITLMREDALRAGRLNWLELNREVQPELRQMVLERDDYTCQKCEATDKPLHCHHIYPASTDPLISADTDNCITLCEDCHKQVHQKDGCRYNDLQMEICYQ